MKSLLDDVESDQQSDYAGLASGIMACTGFAAWTGVSLADALLRTGADGEFHMREAWDTELYVYAGLPFLMLAAAIAGFLMPRQAWRWPLWLIAGQVVGLLLYAVPQGGLVLLPLGLVLFTAATILLLIPAYIGVLGAWVVERT